MNWFSWIRRDSKTCDVGGIVPSHFETLEPGLPTTRWEPNSILQHRTVEQRLARIERNQQEILRLLKELSLK